jgi:Tfp pilus assembly protein PilO
MRNTLLKKAEKDLLNLPVYQRIALISLVFSFILWCGWSLWISELSSGLQRIESENSNLKREIKKKDLQNYRRVLTKIRQERLRLREIQKEYDRKLTYIKSKAREYDFMWFDEERFLQLFEKIMTHTIRLGIRVDKVETLPIVATTRNKYIDTKKRVSIRGAGNFADIVKLLYYIESFKILISIKSVEITLVKSGKDRDFENELRFNIIMEQYGVSL